MLMVEEYRAIPGISNYEVSNTGFIWNKKSGNILTGSISKDGYVRVTLYIDGAKCTRYMHILVAKAFLKNPQNEPEVDHINCNRADNRLENLRYVTIFKNGQNKKVSSRNICGVKGVAFVKKQGSGMLG